MENERAQPAGHEQNPVVLDLIALLDGKRSEIALAWAEMIRRDMAGTTYGRRPVEEIRDNNLVVLDMLKDLLRGSDSLPAVEWTMLPHTLAYFRIGIRAAEIVQAVRLSGRVLTPIVSAAIPPDSSRGREAMLRLEASMGSFAALATEAYSGLLAEYLEEQCRRTELMLDMARGISASLNLKDVLRTAARGIASAAGAEHSAICLIDDDGVTGTLWPGGEVLSPAQASFLGPDEQRVVRVSDTTFVRQVLAAKTVMAWPDVQTDPTVGEDIRALEARAVLGVPCMHNERILAVALVIEYAGPRRFTPEQVELSTGVANVVAPAIENARLHQKVAQLAIAEERARLAQELHDELAQTLGAMRFYASMTGDLLAQQQMPEAELSLFTLQDMIGQAYVDVREAIFNLRSMASLQSGDLVALRGYLARYEQHYGLAVELHADEEAAGVLAGATGVQVLRILQEALTNVRKHGQTPRARAELAREGAWVRVSVQDDGQGFDPASIKSDETPQIGIQVMRERAEIVGGTLSIESRPGHGTRVDLRVPYKERPA